MLGESDPSTLKSIIGLASSYKSQKKYDLAISSYEKYISISSKSGNNGVYVQKVTLALEECKRLRDDNSAEKSSQDSPWELSKLANIYNKLRLNMELPGPDSMEILTEQKIDMALLRSIAAPDNLCNAEEGKKLRRSATVQAEYDAFKAEITANGTSLRDHIIEDVFSGSLDNKPWVLTKNAYPYDVEKNILHLILWHNTPDRDMTGLKTMIEKVLVGTDYVWFANEEDLMSVPAFFHGQIFVRI